nr:selenocysteine-specific translation elongation factor [Chenggangzhangella methanolivorans]
MIIGTAGHVDHGKSALVRALTGVDPDRLKEEKARGVSIDLGFAYLPRDDGSVLGFVDVPGHEKFVRNMLAGASGIDLALIVIAADDGPMPQTREHLAIVDLLGVRRGLVALTKCDLADEGRRGEAVAEIEALLDGSSFEGVEVVPVSVVTGEGLEALQARLDGLASEVARPAADGRFRLSVDRCFTLSGAGTVVTGSVRDGVVRVGDPVIVSLDRRRGAGARHPRPEPACRGGAPRRALRPQSRRAPRLQGGDPPRRRGGRAGAAPADGAHRRRDDGAGGRAEAVRSVDAAAPAPWRGRRRGPARAARGRGDPARRDRAGPARARPSDRRGGARPVRRPRHQRRAHRGGRADPRPARARAPATLARAPRPARRALA